MNANTDLYHPIKLWGYFFAALGICGLLMLSIELPPLFTESSEVKSFEKVFLLTIIAPVVVYHFVMGVALVNKKKLGVMLLKAYLRFLYLGFPIGTYLAIKGLRYLKNVDLDIYLG